MQGLRAGKGGDKVSGLNIAVIAGDGVGPEMMEPAIKVLEAVSRLGGHELELSVVPACGQTIDSCGDPLPEASLNRCRQAKAVLFGNSGLEKYKDFPLEKRPEYCFIDTAAMRLLERPWEFDTVAASNLFGDIIADEGTQLTGTPRLFASAEISAAGPAIYTPNQLHEAGESLTGNDQADPIGMIQAAGLMLRMTFGLEAEARALERAVRQVIRAGYSTRDVMCPGRILTGTRQTGLLVAEALKDEWSRREESGE